MISAKDCSRLMEHYLKLLNQVYLPYIDKTIEEIFETLFSILNHLKMKKEELEYVALKRKDRWKKRKLSEARTVTKETTKKKLKI